MLALMITVPVYKSLGALKQLMRQFFTFVITENIHMSSCASLCPHVCVRVFSALKLPGSVCGHFLPPPPTLLVLPPHLQCFIFPSWSRLIPLHIFVFPLTASWSILDLFFIQCCMIIPSRASLRSFPFHYVRLFDLILELFLFFL